jgi:hypothetical protein
MKAIQITAVTEAACRKIFKNEHSKFATKSMMILADLDREFSFDDRKFTVIGQWINEGLLEIIIRDENKNYFRAGHREVSLMMGYNNYRNHITGIEHIEDHSKKKLVLIEKEK